jgi:putative hydrolase of the HAD superfamily
MGQASAAALQAVIFDYGGVLRGDGRDAWRAVDRAAGLPDDTLWSAWHDIPEYRLSREGAIDARTFRVAMHRTLVPVAGDADRAEAALVALERHLGNLPAVDDHVHAVIERLRAGGRIKLGLLSNAGRGWSERFRARGVATLFDDVVVSGDVGVAKPDPAVFRLAAARLGVAPEGCLMIDDQAQHLSGAEAAGMRTHLYAPNGLPTLVARLEAEGLLTTQHA